MPGWDIARAKVRHYEVQRRGETASYAGIHRSPVSRPRRAISVGRCELAGVADPCVAASTVPVGTSAVIRTPASPQLPRGDPPGSCPVVQPIGLKVTEIT